MAARASARSTKERVPDGDLGAGVNRVVLVGTLSRPPAARELPSGGVMVAYEVTVRLDATGAESVPVVWPSPPRRATELGAGDVVTVVGRVRRRYFRAGGTTASRTEVVAELVAPTRHRRASQLVRQVADHLAEVGR